jgi:hypothetical protein
MAKLTSLPVPLHLRFYCILIERESIFLVYTKTRTIYLICNSRTIKLLGVEAVLYRCFPPETHEKRSYEVSEFQYPWLNLDQSLNFTWSDSEDIFLESLSQNARNDLQGSCPPPSRLSLASDSFLSPLYFNSTMCISRDVILKSKGFDFMPFCGFHAATKVERIPDSLARNRLSSASFWDWNPKFMRCLDSTSLMKSIIRSMSCSSVEYTGCWIVIQFSKSNYMSTCIQLTVWTTLHAVYR